MHSSNAFSSHFCDAFSSCLCDAVSSRFCDAVCFYSCDTASFVVMQLALIFCDALVCDAFFIHAKMTEVPPLFSVC